MGCNHSIKIKPICKYKINSETVDFINSYVDEIKFCIYNNDIIISEENINIIDLDNVKADKLDLLILNINSFNKFLKTDNEVKRTLRTF